MANDTYVPITICIYLSGCVLALVCWPTSAAAAAATDFDLINVTLTNFGRNTVLRAQNGGGLGRDRGERVPGRYSASHYHH